MTHVEFEFYLGLFLVSIGIISIGATLWSGEHQWKNQRYYYMTLLNTTGMVFLGLRYVFHEPIWLQWLLLSVALLFISTGLIFLWRGRASNNQFIGGASMTIPTEVIDFYMSLLVTFGALLLFIYSFRTRKLENETQERYYARLLAPTGLVLVGLSNVFNDPRWLRWSLQVGSLALLIVAVIVLWKGRKR